MTLLDDYEAPFKLRGVQIVQEMLDRVPKEILRRTGVDGLLRTVSPFMRTPTSLNNGPLITDFPSHGSVTQHLSRAPSKSRVR